MIFWSVVRPHSFREGEDCTGLSDLVLAFTDKEQKLFSNFGGSPSGAIHDLFTVRSLMEAVDSLSNGEKSFSVVVTRLGWHAADSRLALQMIRVLSELS